MVGPDITDDRGWIQTEKTLHPTPPRMGYEYYDGSVKWPKDETILFTFDNN